MFSTYRNRFFLRSFGGSSIASQLTILNDCVLFCCCCCCCCDQVSPSASGSFESAAGTVPPWRIPPSSDPFCRSVIPIHSFLSIQSASNCLPTTSTIGGISRKPSKEKTKFGKKKSNYRKPS